MPSYPVPLVLVFDGKTARSNFSMEMSDTNLLILALSAIGFGLYLLVKGGDWTIDSAVGIATRFNIPKMIIGFTIVAFGTSLPELIVAVNANLKGLSGIALGNVIGSNIANILLVIAIAAIVDPITTTLKDCLKDIVFLFVATLAFAFILIYVGSVPQHIGLLMIAILLAYITWQITSSNKKQTQDASNISDILEDEKNALLPPILLLILGLTGVAIGAEILVRGAEVAASIIGVPDALIGLTIIAIGTSLPELSTCLSAVKKGEGDIVLGNIIGSNVFNILMIIGVTAAIKEIPAEAITPQLINFDIIVMSVISILFGTWILWFKGLSRATGLIMLLGYGAYIGLLYFTYMV